jgi:hypothetical protein
VRPVMGRYASPGANPDLTSTGRTKGGLKRILGTGTGTHEQPDPNTTKPARHELFVRPGTGSEDPLEPAFRASGYGPVCIARCESGPKIAGA